VTAMYRSTLGDYSVRHFADLPTDGCLDRSVFSTYPAAAAFRIYCAVPATRIPIRALSSKLPLPA
jgi:hypothetical protein